MNPEPPSPEKIPADAALWVAKLEYGLTAAEQDQFLEWLIADPRHGAELSRQKSHWNRLNLLADWRPEHGERPNRDLLTPDLKRPARRGRSRLYWLVGSSLAAAAVLALGVFFLQRDKPAHPVSAVPTQLSTIEQRTLADGSVIECNRGAEYSVRFSATERRVRLERGEASFEVARNADRPFIVTAGGVDIVAVGTAFNVRLAATAVEVLVTEGKVQVQPPEGVSGAGTSVKPSATLLRAGEQARVPLTAVAPAPTVAAVNQAQMDQILAWKPRWLDFTETPLQSVVEEFNRRNAPVRIVIADGGLSNTMVSASLRSDNIETLLRLLEGTFGVSIDREGNTITLHKVQRP